MSNFSLFLNSTSPRRLEILTKIVSLLDPNLKICVVKPSFEEDLVKSEFSSSKEYLLENTKRKCCSEVITKVASQTEEEKLAIIISADTILTNGQYSKVLEKPKSFDHNYNMIIEQLEDGCVVCMTCVQILVIKAEKVIEETQFLSEANVILDQSLLKNKTENLDLIKKYVDSKEGLDAAGGFKIQETGSFMVQKIEGDFYTVVGLPFNATLMSLNKIISKHK